MNQTSFYLAARYSRREELCAYRSDLEARGHVAPARWLAGAGPEGRHPLPEPLPERLEQAGAT